MEQSYFGAIEAVLFACGEPLELERLAAALSIEPAAARQQLDAYGKALADSGRGLRLLMLDGAAQLCVKEEYEPQVMAAAAVKKNAPLSAAALETLAVVAYNQPATKAFIERVRGVECGAVVNSPAGCRPRDVPSFIKRRRLSYAASVWTALPRCRRCRSRKAPRRIRREADRHRKHYTCYHGGALERP